MRTVAASRERAVLAVLTSALLVTAIAFLAWGVPYTSLIGDWIGFYRDGLFYEAYVRTAVDAPWFSSWLQSETFGWPLGMNLEYFFAGEYLHLFVLKAASSLVGVGTAMNLYVLVGFPLALLTAYLFFRRAEFPLLPALLFAAAFALLPYHFLRATEHIFLGMIWVIPLGVLPALMAVAALGDDKHQRWGGWGAGRRDWVVVVASSAAIGASGAYYAFFTLLMWIPTGLYILVRRPRVWGWLLSPVVVSLSLTLSLAPSLLARALNPPFAPVNARDAEDALRFSGTLIDLDSGFLTGFFPAQRTFEAWGAGLIGQLAVLGAFGILAATWLIPTSRSWMNQVTNRWLAGLAVWLLLWWLTGGLGYLFAVVVTPQFRSLGRLLPFLVLICMALAGRVLLRWLASSPTRVRVAASGLFSALLVLATVAQVISPRLAEPAELIAARERASSTVEQTQAAVGESCPLGQLPVVPAPEGVSPGAMPPQADFEVGLVAAASTPVSHGAIVNTEAAAWQTPYYYSDAATGARLLTSLGFCAVIVDLRAYENPDVVVSALTRQLGTPLALDEDRASFALGATGTVSVADRESLLTPALAVGQPGKTRSLNTPYGTQLLPERGPTFGDALAPVRVWNPSSQDRQVTIRSGGAPGSSLLSVDWIEDNQPESAPIEQLVIDVPAGSYADVSLPVPEDAEAVTVRVCLVGELVVTSTGLGRCTV